MKTKIYVVSSTHWDREWIIPFEKFRFKLVRLLDRLIETMEKNPTYKYFHFDGQTSVIDDYLEMRPENKERLLKLIREGRILVGPFRNMLDCLLPSGEAIVRNLQAGLSDCIKWGTRPHSMGYVCDVFGHNAQMPQIYKNFNIDNCLLMRGLPDYEYDKFLWRGKDGSEIIAHRADSDFTYADFYLMARFPAQMSGKFDLAKMAESVKKNLDDAKSKFIGNRHFMIDGYDNLEPEEKLPEYIEYLNNNLTDYEFILSDFDDYNAECRKVKSELSLLEGIIYQSAKDGSSAYLMKNVSSSMVSLKQMNMLAEDKLSVVAEPLDLFSEIIRGDIGEEYYPISRTCFFNYAWDKTITNQPHDSLGGTCSTAAHLDNENNYKRAIENVDVALEDTLTEISANVSVKSDKDGNFIVYNPCESDFDGIATVKFKVPADVNFSESVLRTYDGELIPFTVLNKSTAFEQLAAFKKMAEYVKYDTYTVALPLKLKAFSYTVLNYETPKAERNFLGGEWKFSRLDKPRREYSSMRIAEDTFDNGAITVSINANGSIDVTDKESGEVYKNLFVPQDDSDIGEGWNRRSTPIDEKVSGLIGDASFSIINDDERIARFRIRRKMTLPECKDGSFMRNGELKTLALDMVFSIKKGEKIIECEASLTNNVDNHRLRMVFPTAINSEKFYTALPFGMQEWKVENNKKSHEYDIEPFTPTVPGQGILTISDNKRAFSLYTKGLYEFEVSEKKDRAVYLTLFRAFPKETFFLKSDMAELKKPMKFEFAVDFTNRSFSQLYKKSKAYRAEIVSHIADKGNNTLGATYSFAKIEGGAVLSSLRSSDLITGKRTIRLFDVDGGCSGFVAFSEKIKKAVRVKMNGEKICDETIKDGKLYYTLKNSEIATWQFELEENKK